MATLSSKTFSLLSKYTNFPKKKKQKHKRPKLTTENLNTTMHVYIMSKIRYFLYLVKYV